MNKTVSEGECQINTILGQPRYSSIDALKAIAAFLVVCIHQPFPGILGDGVLAVARTAVPCFFMISGFLVYCDDKAKRIQRTMKQIRRVAVIALVSTIIFLFWNISLNVHAGTLAGFFGKMFNFKSLGILIFLNEVPFGGHLWYLFALLYVLIIYAIIQRFDEKKMYRSIYWIIPTLLITDLMFGKYSLVLFGREFSYLLVRNFVFVGFPYFMIGCLIKRCKSRAVFSRMNPNLLLLGCLLFTLTTLLEKYILIVSELSTVREHYFSTTIAVVCIFLFGVLKPTSFKGGWLEKVGREYSLMIYIVHPIFISLLFKMAEVLKVSVAYSYVAPIAVFVASLTFACVYYKTLSFTKYKGGGKNEYTL